MQRYKITISYLGTNYCGWQNQKNGVSIQEVLESAFLKLFGQTTPVTASGRTDAGVHARAQVAHFDCKTSIPEDKIPFAVNTLLPEDIRVTSCKKVSNDFHARFSAKEKTYMYSIYIAPHIDPLKNNISENITVPLDIDAMKKGAKYIEGEHDFKCFEATGSSVKDTIRIVKKIDIVEENNLINIYVTGNGFLYNMVRIISGTLVDVGKGKICPSDIENIILSGDRTKAGKTLPSKGLTLISVKY